jgi:hypothetical protein
MIAPITYFTKVQKEVEKWVSNAGFKVKSEVDVENYRVDLVISELELVIEVDGPSHRKLRTGGSLIVIGSHTANKRDNVLLKYYRNGVWHIPVNITEDEFKSKFKEILGGLDA